LTRYADLALETLKSMAPLDRNGVLAVLAVALSDTSNSSVYRWDAYLLGGGSGDNPVLARSLVTQANLQ
jgi:hypothetical protein